MPVTRIHLYFNGNIFLNVAHLEFKAPSQMLHSSTINVHSYCFSCIFAVAAQTGGSETALLYATAVHAYK